MRTNTHPIAVVTKSSVGEAALWSSRFPPVVVVVLFGGGGGGGGGGVCGPVNSTTRPWQLEAGPSSYTRTSHARPSVRTGPLSRGRASRPSDGARARALFIASRGGRDKRRVIQAEFFVFFFLLFNPFARAYVMYFVNRRRRQRRATVRRRQLPTLFVTGARPDGRIVAETRAPTVARPVAAAAAAVTATRRSLWE